MFRNIRSSLFVTPALLLATGCMLDLPDPNATQSYPCARRSDCLSGYECFNGFCEDRSNCVDRDGDGHSPPMDGCGGGGDCDDADAAVFNGSAPLDSETSCMRDADGDDYGDNDVVLGGSVVAGTDCDDSNAAVFTGAAPLDNAGACMKDADGDDYGDGNVASPVVGGSDCNDNDVNVFPGAAERESTSACKRDADGDGFGEFEPDDDITPGTDCDDGDQYAFPGSAPNETAPALCYRDADDDNYGDDAFATNHAIGTDCLDSDAFAFPGAAQNESTTVCMRDADNDGYGDVNASSPVFGGTDCNDGQAATFPGNTENCSDLIENNCDSLMDCAHAGCSGLPVCLPAIASTFPPVTGWTEEGGANIEMTFADLDPSAPGATTYECRTGPLGSIDSQAWSRCDGAAGDTPVYHPTPVPGSTDGSYRSEVRFRFSPTVTGPLIGYEYYAHASLNGAGACSLPVTETQLFTFAKTYLTTATTFAPTSLALDNPFLTVKFTPGGTFTSSPLSLRHRFSLSSDNTLLLMTRRYRSRRNPADASLGCLATVVDLHCAQNTPRAAACVALGKYRLHYRCDAVVFNEKGAGVCLKVVPGLMPTIQLLRTETLMYRELGPAFSPKTTSTGWPADYLYLPL